ncbi:MAG TPA: hypothetical protein VFZ64_05310 [Nocardioidaceae bacterium]
MLHRRARAAVERGGGRPASGPTPRPAPALVPALVLGLALVACDASVEVDLAPTPTSAPASSPSPEATSPGPSVTSSETPSAATSGSASPSASPLAPTTSPARPRRLTDRLLTAEEVPGFNDRFTWKVARTRTAEGTEPFGTCQRFEMTTIGAMRVVVREYAPATASPGSTAGHLVAEFADRETARRAYEVLQSWRGTCEEQLRRYDRRQVGALEPVRVSGGEGGWYLLVYGPPEDGSADEGYFDAQGAALVGTRIALLRMRLVGQDYNYPAGREPMVEAVRTAAARLR